MYDPRVVRGNTYAAKNLPLVITINYMIYILKINQYNTINIHIKTKF